MKRQITKTISIFIAMFVLSIYIFININVSATSSVYNIYTDSYAAKLLVKYIAGKNANVLNLLDSDHTFQSYKYSDNDKKIIVNNSDAFFVTSKLHNNDLSKLDNNLKLSGLIVQSLDRNIKYDAGHNDESIFLDPNEILIIANQINSSLQNIMPDKKELLQENYNKLENQLMSVILKYNQLSIVKKNLAFIADNPKIFYYIAKNSNLTVNDANKDDLSKLSNTFYIVTDEKNAALLKDKIKDKQQIVFKDYTYKSDSDIVSDIIENYNAINSALEIIQGGK